MDNTWFLEYRNETDHLRRAEMLKKAEAEGADEAVELRRKIYEARYDEKKGQRVDYFIRGLVNFKSLRRRIYFPGEKKLMRRDVDNVERDWQFPLCAKHGEVGERALYDELYNLTLFYMEICERDKMYNSVFLGLFSISQERREQKIGEDLYETSITIPEKLGVKEELRLFSKAVYDAYLYRYPSEAREIFGKE